MTKNEKRVVLAVFSTVEGFSEEFLRANFGSETIKEYRKILHRLRYSDYAKSIGKKLSELDENDYACYYCQKN